MPKRRRVEGPIVAGDQEVPSSSVQMGVRTVQTLPSLTTLRDQMHRLRIDQMEEDDLTITDNMKHRLPGNVAFGDMVLTNWIEKVEVAADATGGIFAMGIRQAAAVPAAANDIGPNILLQGGHGESSGVGIGPGRSFLVKRVWPFPVIGAQTSGGIALKVRIHRVSVLITAREFWRVMLEEFDIDLDTWLPSYAGVWLSALAYAYGIRQFSGLFTGVIPGSTLKGQTLTNGGWSLDKFYAHNRTEAGAGASGRVGGIPGFGG